MGALLFALSLEKVSFVKNMFFKKDPFSDELPTLRVGCSVTRLTVYWAFPYQSNSKFWSKRGATVDKKHILK